MDQDRTERCPYCNQTITRTDLERIEERLKVEFAQKMKSAEEEASTKLEKDRAKLEEIKNALQSEQTRLEQLQKTLSTEKERLQEKLRAEFDERLKKDIAAREKELVDEGKRAGRIEADAEKRNLQKKVDELSRQIEKKTADELGSLSEEELAKRLAEAFRVDNISRIPKGEQGADVRHEVIFNGLPCGLIIYESKNRKDWQNAYTDRAKEYKTMYNTPYVLLVSITFPSGEQNCCIRDSIIIVHPSIVIPVASILRATILRLHHLNTSQQEIATKMTEVYRFISGDEFKVQIDSMFQNISDLQKIQKDEQRSHQNNWTKQTTLFDALQRSTFMIQNKIDNIIQNTD